MKDLDILDGLQAADIDENIPEQDRPFRNINIEDLTSAEGIIVSMKEQTGIAEKAAYVASEGLRIAKEGMIDLSTARNLAKEVPEIMGTPSTPVSYTSVPTKVGVSKAVEILQGNASSSRDAVLVKMNDLIDRSIVVMQNSINHFQTEWVGALVSYGVSRAKALEEFGDLPEQSNQVFLDGKTGYELGLSIIDKHQSDEGNLDGGLVAKFIETVAPFINYSFNSLEYKLLTKIPLYAVGESVYTTNNVIDAIALLEVPAKRTQTLAHWLAAPLSNGENNSKIMIDLGFKFIERLRTIAKSMKTGEDCVLSESELSHLSAKALYITTVIAQITKALEGFIAATKAASAFYEEALHVSTTAQPRAATENFVAKRKRLI